MLKKNWKNHKNCSKIAKKSLFFSFLGKIFFLNWTLGLGNFFLDQTTYVQKNRLYQQFFVNQDPTIPQNLKLKRIVEIYWKANLQIKCIYSEKATKFCEISNLLLSYVVPVKSKVEISENFVAFAEYMNFKGGKFSEDIKVKSSDFLWAKSWRTGRF